MNIVDKFNIPIAKNKIEDGFHAILTGAVRTLYEDYKKIPATDPKDRENLINLLNFARRMNFNTDEFRMN
jgi:hypothetical protein